MFALKFLQLARTPCIKLVLIQFLLVLLLVFAPQSSRADTDAAANAIQTTLYEAAITAEAAERQWNDRFKRQRDRIEELSLQVALSEDAEGAALVAANELREELRLTQKAFTDELAAQDRAYQAELAVFRDSLQAITATPEGLAALEIYNAGDRQRARAILRDLREARDRARQMRVDIESASELRDIAGLELDMRLRGELTTAEVLTTFQEITSLDPGVHWDWVELTRLYVVVGDLSRAEDTARRAASTAGSDRDHTVAFNKVGDVQRAQGDLPGALASYQAGLEIAETLAARDPSNSGWRRDLVVSHFKIAQVSQSSGNKDAAIASLRAAQTINAGLIQLDTTNVQWANDQSMIEQFLASLEDG